jgi:transposase
MFVIRCDTPAGIAFKEIEATLKGMGAPYSEDLRLRVLAALDGGMSKMVAHRTFRVSRSTIDDWLKLREQTGGVQANTSYRRGQTPALNDLTAFAEFAGRHQSCTLGQMAVAWQAETGQKLSLMPFCEALRRIGWTRKKRVGATASGASQSARSFSGN